MTLPQRDIITGHLRALGSRLFYFFLGKIYVKYFKLPLQEVFGDVCWVA